MVEISGPWLSVPVLRQAWPALDSITKPDRDRLRAAHASWRGGQSTTVEWINYVLRDLLRWDDGLHMGGLEHLAVQLPLQGTMIKPTFALTIPGEEPKPDAIRLLGIITSENLSSQTGMLASTCRKLGVELGLVTDGRRWTLVWVPADRTATGTFDAANWPERAERDVVRAFFSLLNADRFFTVPESERLPALFHASGQSSEDITEALGVQVRQAVELLVTSVGRMTQEEDSLHHVPAHDIYRGAVTVMMRVVFVLYAEERGVLPADNDLYAASYSVGQLCADLERRALAGSEEELTHSTAAWHRLLALFTVVYNGTDHPRLKIHAYDGSLFNAEHHWLPKTVDDRTVLHMLRAIQYAEFGKGRNRERRKLSFRSLDVEQIGYVYEGLLSFDAQRSTEVAIGLIGKPGREKEVELTIIERIGPDPAALAERFKDSGIGTAGALARRLTPLDDAGNLEATRKLLAATEGDAEVAKRLLPYYGIIRRDLRGLPLVILPGTPYVTESQVRRATGSHYTPRDLAERIVKGALEPLIYRVGPLQTAELKEWIPKSSDEILSLRIADIAMGSGAFLVSAARYLGEALIAAWKREGRIDDAACTDAEDDPLQAAARREIIERCLYGADINPMAVELAKLSLWLVSVQSDRSFTFLDDRLVVGDSLLGLTSVEQLECLQLSEDVPALLSEAAGRRRGIVEIEVTGDPLKALARKRAVLRSVGEDMEHVRSAADLLVGALLAHATGEGRGKARGLTVAIQKASALTVSGNPERQNEQARQWLAADLPKDVLERLPLHWMLTFPEVFAREDAGFDAIIGNPPFLGGQKLTGEYGVGYREYLLHRVGRGDRGSADLAAYFVLRAHELLNSAGQTGLIATNTLAQGDTRQVGLDRLVAEGVTIRLAEKSKPWPTKSAVLEYCAVWTTRVAPGRKSLRIADGRVVRGITASLDPESGVSGTPRRLPSSGGIAFIGSYVLGLGFTMEPEAAKAMIERDPRNKDVLALYLNGQDLNSRPDSSGSRWVINFHDWDLDRAKTYAEPFEQVVRLVKPERDRNNRAVRRERWWQYAERAPKLVEAIAGLERVIALTRVSKVVMPVMVPTGQVISEAVVVFATDDTAMLTLLSSAPHYWWVRARASSMKADLRYTPSDVFETLPLPHLTPEMRTLGHHLDTHRRELMLSRQAGLTATYNLVNNPTNTDPDIAQLRQIHRDIDIATCHAYGWHDLIDKLDHGHHQVARETRFTVGPAVQRELVDRLLGLNLGRRAKSAVA